ncbi:MAG: biotin--[acetyl-CoA-carboxylase] ligase [Alphaproteobacteria bacterium]|nr:biotin--[acetyl-CoA-carboxylase] ligase [Alphaproteobacteria bacterium]
MSLALPVLPAGCRLVALGTVGSTNDEARALAVAGAPDRTFVWAREQNAGRGRRGTDWTSPPGNLYVTAILRPGVPAARAMQLSFIVAVAMAEAIEQTCGIALTLKWPNDLLLDGRKTAGILLESSGTGTLVDWLVAGTGVNLVSHPEALRTATHLAAAGADLAPEELLPRYAGCLSGWIDRWTAGGFPPVRAAWLARASGLGGPIVLRLPDRELAGTFADLDETGALVLDAPEGRRTVTAGEVFAAAV